MERKHYRIIMFFVIAALSAVLLWFLLPKAVVLLLPFVLAYVISKIIDPVVMFLSKKLKIPKKLASAIMVLITLGVIIGIVSMLVTGIVNEISSLAAQKDMIGQKIYATFYNWYDFTEKYFGREAADFITDNIDVKKITSNITGYLAGYIMPTIENAFDIAKQFPNIIIFIVVLFMGTYFMSSDSETVSDTLHKLIPKWATSTTDELKKDMTSALLGYIRAQCILMTVSFVELTVGFTIIGGGIASYALLLGLCIAILDALPVLGAGLILIPWAIYSLIAGKIRVGISLFILYGVCLLVRQILEPRIVGKQIGLHPLLTLMAMYIGLRLFGFLGMILGPVTVLIIKNLADTGVFGRFWNYVCYGKSCP